MKSIAEYEVNGDEFVIQNYNDSKPFASFFPAIAGLWGKPLWVFYVNRGQSISCLGTKDKNGAINEFLAANKAYRQTGLTGFRTFLMEGEKLYEPFKTPAPGKEKKIRQSMHITSYLLKLVEDNSESGIRTTVEYFTVPNENVPALARIVTLENMSRKKKSLQCLDGMAMINPYGTGDFLLKNMSRLAEAWFSGVTYIGKNKAPVFKLEIEPEDKPEIDVIEPGNFYYGFVEKNGRVNVPEFIINPDQVFGQRADFTVPVGFMSAPNLKNDPAITAKNKTPCSFGRFKADLEAGKSVRYFSIVGNVNKTELLPPFLRRVEGPEFFHTKKQENRDLIRKISGNILTKSDSPQFDNYCQQTYLDNLLRGGYPVTLGTGDRKAVYWTYSRIHGDMEREYNNFVIDPVFFSQGNGSYRDVNQNRRNDIFFNQDVGAESYTYFINLIQADGFNPLGIIGSKFSITNKKDFVNLFKTEFRKKISAFIEQPFALGAFFNYIEEENISLPVKRDMLLDKILENGEKISYASPNVGYWSDHWHYNTDLVEAFLAVFPDRLKDLFLKKKDFTYYDNPMVVLPRDEKYVLYNGKPRQIDAVMTHAGKEAMIASRSKDPNLMRTKYGKGSVYKTNLLSKLLILAANKFASMDYEGIGVEMESDKPNWCDALNGLSGWFGSSTAESIELKRLMIFILEMLEKSGASDSMPVKLFEEAYTLITKLESLTKSEKDLFAFWDKGHVAKEQYRARTLMGISGAEKTITVAKVKSVLKLFLDRVEKGQKKMEDKSGMVRTNYAWNVVKYEQIKKGSSPVLSRNGYPCIRVKKFSRKELPYFLEGPVHYLRINKDPEKAMKFHKALCQTGLYDKKLEMFKVNAPLTNESHSLGRIKIFTPGWLENESVWLHMEYKYLLEMIRNDLCDEFYKNIETSLVPFMDPGQYGRSIFENVSFIASSAHPEESTHGQGFVARLSGSTAEFMSIWLAMTSGLVPFSEENGKLVLEFSPKLKGTFFTRTSSKVENYLPNGKSEVISVPKNSFLFKFLAHTPVIYNNPDRKNTWGKNGASVKQVKLHYHNGKVIVLESAQISSPFAQEIREKKVRLINIQLG